jgi:two-component system OmpR family sensor kinase
LSRLREQAPSADVSSELAALRQQVEELRQAVRARDDFIAIAAHELRNPMTPLLGVTDLALAAARAAAGTCPPRITTLLERMQLLTRDFIQRSTRLLDVSRIATGNLRLEPSATDLSALVLSIVRKYEVAAARVRSPVELGIQDGITGVWDRLAIEQVTENLLSNALKFGAGKPVAVRLRTHGAAAWLDVQDRGIGMEPDQQARIFGRFEQIVAQHQGLGFGVGLWVANHLVMAMGGQIAVLSHPGEGSTFTVTLPLTPSDPDRTTHDAT